ncbi:galactose oxidase [Aspergillus uvarum CBS 121591]|uniref:Galactose oxidase n=1 Tax=Aspergillus uvarum CBS 121591 TaxID=1448315 RepID=A0A319CIU4_9EURO|nr:galactose oxidase [Aspergillus uvarum CBS 121591]PYH78613.1 galactose oxidase [Aspergillus uvarum CBS 121591]
MPVSLSALGLTVLGLVGVATAAPSCNPGQWVNLTSIPQPAPHKVNHANAPKVGEKLYLLGGLIEAPLSPGVTMNWVATRACYVYDPAVDAWREIELMPRGTEKGSAVVGVHEEMVYLAGGMTVLQTGKGRMLVSRGGLSGSAVGGELYVFGGEGNVDAATGVFNQTQKYKPQSQKWTELAPMPIPRHGSQAVGLDSRVYIPGGGLQQDGKSVSIGGGPVTFQHPTPHFDA